jgi:hypothetical protein
MIPGLTPSIHVTDPYSLHIVHSFGNADCKFSELLSKQLLMFNRDFKPIGWFFSNSRGGSTFPIGAKRTVQAAACPALSI